MTRPGVPHRDAQFCSVLAASSDALVTSSFLKQLLENAGKGSPDVNQYALYKKRVQNVL